MWAVITALVTLAFFVVTLRPGVGGTEDSPKFQFIGEALGTAHSPGYPFYVMATWLFTRVDLGTLAYRVNLFSAVCGALSCVCIFLTARRIGVTRLLSLAAALAAATSYPVWSNSVTAEVYTLAAVLSGMAVYWLIAFAQTGATWRLYAACAMWAAGFGNHLTIVGILPAALIYGVVKDRSVLRPRVATNCRPNAASGQSCTQTGVMKPTTSPHRFAIMPSVPAAAPKISSTSACFFQKPIAIAISVNRIASEPMFTRMPLSSIGTSIAATALCAW